MNSKHGNLSIDSNNIFPIIKKWLYSDNDIFYRELVSNCCDAITKLKKLSVIGEYDLPDDYEPKINILVSPENKTIKVIDNGLGMTGEEVEKYINQIAFSGATDFIEKYKDKSSEDQIIGHFGLGFYSVFMVADEVHIDTLSYQKGATPVHWECDGGTEFDMSDGSWDQVGTRVTLFLNEDCLEFANEYRAEEVLKKYCGFMPTPIYLKNEDAEPQYETVLQSELTEKDTVIEKFVEEAKTEERENDKGEKETVEISPRQEKAKILKRPVPVNEIHPLWMRNPSECTDEDYKKFYRTTFNDYKEPLFWIHLNMDYPFNLKGIIYFPKINTEYDSIEGDIKLYNNQVFVADNIKEVVPEYFMLLKGVIDCPDLPLNVSRSALQNDGFVKKISDYISKKVADKLIGMCKTDKETYEKYWDDISPFIKYGCLKDTKFCDKMNDYILFKNLDGKYLTLPELLVKEEEKEEAEKAEAEAEGKTAEEGAEAASEVVDSETGEAAAEESGETAAEEESAEETADTEGTSEAEEESAENEEDEEEEKDTRKTIYYVTDVNQQGQYIQMFKEQNMQAVILDQTIDSSFISQLESRNENYKFMRIDADVTESLREEVSEEDVKEALDALAQIFRKALNNENLDVKVEKLKDTDIASVITVSEEERRMEDMIRMYGMDTSSFKASETLTLNLNNELVKYILDNPESENVPMFCEQIYDLAKLSNKPLDSAEMKKFVQRSNKIMMLLAK